MRYLWLVLLAVFIYFSIIFISQNTQPVSINFVINWIGINYDSKRPLFYPIFMALAGGIIFCVGYFFSHHSQLRLLNKTQTKEVKRLKRLVLVERKKNAEMEQRNHELQQIVERVQKQIDDQEWQKEIRKLPESA